MTEDAHVDAHAHYILDITNRHTVTGLILWPFIMLLMTVILQLLYSKILKLCFLMKKPFVF